MIIEINHDIDKFEESIFWGLNPRQLIFSTLSLISGGGVVYFLTPFLGLTGSAYVAIFLCIPLAVSGFYEYEGMTLYQTMKLRLFFLLGKNRSLSYRSTERIEERRSYGYIFKRFSSAKKSR